MTITEAQSVSEVICLKVCSNVETAEAEAEQGKTEKRLTKDSGHMPRYYDRAQSHEGSESISPTLFEFREMSWSTPSSLKKSKIDL